MTRTGAISFTAQGRPCMSLSITNENKTLTGLNFDSKFRDFFPKQKGFQLKEEVTNKSNKLEHKYSQAFMETNVSKLSSANLALVMQYWGGKIANCYSKLVIIFPTEKYFCFCVSCKLLRFMLLNL